MSVGVGVVVVGEQAWSYPTVKRTLWVILLLKLFLFCLYIESDKMSVVSPTGGGSGGRESVGERVRWMGRYEVGREREVVRMGGRGRGFKEVGR